MAQIVVFERFASLVEHDDLMRSLNSKEKKLFDELTMVLDRINLRKEQLWKDAESQAKGGFMNA